MHIERWRCSRALSCLRRWSHIVPRVDWSSHQPATSIPILFEDDAAGYAVINKPAGINVQTSIKHNSPLESVEGVFMQRGYKRLYFPHRLDKWTSGLLVIAFNKTAAGELGRQLTQHLWTKKYYALVDLPRCLVSYYRGMQTTPPAGNKPLLSAPFTCDLISPNHSGSILEPTATSWATLLRKHGTFDSWLSRKPFVMNAPPGSLPLFGSAADHRSSQCSSTPSLCALCRHIRSNVGGLERHAWQWGLYAHPFIYTNKLLSWSLPQTSPFVLLQKASVDEAIAQTNADAADTRMTRPMLDRQARKAARARYMEQRRSSKVGLYWKVQHAHTEYELREVWWGAGTALYSATLRTGRHHQLRVQFADAGIPVQGDPYYNPHFIDELARRSIRGATREVEDDAEDSALEFGLRLMAYYLKMPKLGVPQNSPNRWLEIELPMPESWRQAAETGSVLNSLSNIST